MSLTFAATPNWRRRFALVDDLAAAQLARGLREMGVTPNTPFDAATLQVAAPMRPVFERLMAGLVRHGLLRKKKRAI